MTFTPGSLRDRIREVSATATQSGALWVTPTDSVSVADGGVDFRIYRVLKSSRRQRRAVKKQLKGTNPFLPYDQELFVADVSKSHVCLLNKFNVVIQHALLVTREFTPQEAPLDAADFDALCRCLKEIDGLCFYNAGRDAGASQPHKHMQMVPLPLTESGPSAPIDSLLDEERAPPFRHALRRWSSPFDAEQALDHYVDLMRQLDLDPTVNPTAPYNLLVTRRWMMVVPRTREKFEGVSLNSLAFAGVLLARNDEQLEVFRRAGPMSALQHVTR